MKPKSSYIWHYYSAIDDNSAKCNTCGKSYSRKGRTTTPLKGHLKSMHREVYEEFCKMEEQREGMLLDQTTTDAPLQPVERQLLLEEISSIFWAPSHPKARKMDDVIGEMIALQNLPFHFVEGIGFRRVMQTALPNYRLRGGQYFTDHICDEIYAKMATKIGVILENLLKMSFTVYIWSEPTANVSLLSLTAHGITEDFTRVQMVLKCCPLEGRHTDDIICDNLKIMLRDWNIQNEQVHCFIKDGESNVFKTISNIPVVNSILHEINLCVRSALETLEVKKLVAKCRQISEHFSHSQTAQDELTQIQRNQLNQPTFSVIQEYDNRWNSTFNMIKRLLEIKNSICVYASKHDIIQISPEEWLSLSKLVAILTSFEEITCILSDKNTCLSSLIPLIFGLKHSLNLEKDKFDTSQSFKSIIQDILREITRRSSDIATNKIYWLATYLDPRYKLKFFDEIIQEQVQSTLLLLLSLHYLNDDSAAKKARVRQNSMYGEPSTSVQSVHSKLAEILNSSDDEDETEDDNDNAVTNDIKIWKSLINEYNNEARLQLSENPLMWWKYNIKYKVFAPIVRACLSAPSNSVPNEPIFSRAGLVYEPLKNRLEKDKIEKLLFVKYNLPLLNFDY